MLGVVEGERFYILAQEILENVYMLQILGKTFGKTPCCSEDTKELYSGVGVG